MTADYDGLYPGLYGRLYVFNQYGAAEHGAVKYGPYRPVRAFPHLLKVVFLNPLLIRGNGGALHADPVLLYRFGSVTGYPVVGLIPF